MSDERLSALRPVDVSAVRAERLRTRCHAALSTGRASAHDGVGLPWARWFARALGGAWSAIYAIEALRRALAFYRP